MKYCKDCEHYGGGYLCYFQPNRGEVINLIKGPVVRINYRDCEDERNSDDESKCGKDARFFQLKALISSKSLFTRLFKC